MRKWLGLFALWSALGAVDRASAVEPVRLRILPLDLVSEPARYLLRVECGDFSLSRIDAGLILPPATISGQIDFGGCTQVQIGLWGCTNAPRLGPDVDGSNSGALGPGWQHAGRSDTLYTSLRGAPLLCSPGKTADLVEIRAANFAPDPAPMLVATSQRVDDVFNQETALDGNGQPIPIDQLRFETGVADDGTGTRLIVRRMPESDQVPTHRFEIVLDSEIELSRVTLGFILPEGLAASQVVFGGCTSFMPLNLPVRECSGGSPDLGFNVDPDTSIAIGPSQALLQEGGRGDTLYLVLEGARDIGSQRRVLNRAGMPSRLGVIDFDPGISLGFEDLLPSYVGLVLGSALFPEWLDHMGTRVPLSDRSGAEPSAAPDYDRDGGADDYDLCPWYAESVPSADTDEDLRGDECECTDQNGDGTHSVVDLVMINAAIFMPALITPLCDGNNDGACNVSDIIAANIELFSPGHTATCSRFPFPRLP